MNPYIVKPLISISSEESREGAHCFSGFILCTLHHSSFPFCQASQTQRPNIFPSQIPFWKETFNHRQTFMWSLASGNGFWKGAHYFLVIRAPHHSQTVCIVYMTFRGSIIFFWESEILVHPRQTEFIWLDTHRNFRHWFFNRLSWEISQQCLAGQGDVTCIFHLERLLDACALVPIDFAQSSFLFKVLLSCMLSCNNLGLW